MQQRRAAQTPELSPPGRAGGRLARPRGVRLGASSRDGTTRRDPGSRRGWGGVAGEAGKTSPGGRLEGNALPTRLLGGGESHGDAGGARGGRHGVPRGSRARSPAARTEGGREGGKAGTGKPKPGKHSENNAGIHPLSNGGGLSEADTQSPEPRKERKDTLRPHTYKRKQTTISARTATKSKDNTWVRGWGKRTRGHEKTWISKWTDHSPRAGVGVGVGDGGGGARGNAGGWGGGGGARVEPMAIQ